MTVPKRRPAEPPLVDQAEVAGFQRAATNPSTVTKPNSAMKTERAVPVSVEALDHDAGRVIRYTK